MFLYLIRRFDETSSDFTLEKLMEVKLHNFSEQINAVSKKSTLELSLENVLNNHKINNNIILKQIVTLYFYISRQ